MNARQSCAAGLLLAACHLCPTAFAQVGLTGVADDGTASYDHILQLPEGADPEYLTNAYFGPTGSNFVTISASSGIPYTSVSWAARTTDGARQYCTSDCQLSFSVELPSGARINRIEANIYDADDNGQVRAALLSCDADGTALCKNVVPTLASGTPDEPGAAILGQDVDALVDNALYSLLVFVELSGNTSATAIKNFRVGWQRQISPAPAVATFTDVPTGHAFFQEIEALAASGVTTGCGAGSYCPDGFVTRGQLAAFLARALGL